MIDHGPCPDRTVFTKFKKFQKDPHRIKERNMECSEGLRYKFEQLAERHRSSARDLQCERLWTISALEHHVTKILQFVLSYGSSGTPTGSSNGLLMATYF